jgi:hypothetical protein
VVVSFSNMENKNFQITCQVAHSRAYTSGKRKIGLSFRGTPQEIEDFIGQLVKSHHYSS